MNAVMMNWIVKPDVWWQHLSSHFESIKTYQNDLLNHVQTLSNGISNMFTTIYDFYHYCDSYSDAKLRDWPLMHSPIGPVLILVAYFTMVYYGKRYVHKNGRNVYGDRTKRPTTSHHHHHHHRYSLFTEAIFTYVLILYNFAMSLLNAWISYELLYCGLKRKYNFLCQLVYEDVDDPYETRIAQAIWWYFASKGIELLDTVFIVYKRKPNQLTFLHVYHHSTMFVVWWVGAKFVPGGSALSGALVNCVVHVLMYAYYAFSAMGPNVRPYLWWKKYLTIIQLIQFTAGVSLGLNSILTNCQFTRWMQYVFVCYAFSFLILFGKFYRNTYWLGGGRAKQINQTKENKSVTNVSRATIRKLLSRSIDNEDRHRTGTTVHGSSSSKQSKQSKLSVLKAKHHYGSMARRRKMAKNSGAS